MHQCSYECKMRQNRQVVAPISGGCLEWANLFIVAKTNGRYSSALIGKLNWAGRRFIVYPQLATECLSDCISTNHSTINKNPSYQSPESAVAIAPATTATVEETTPNRQSPIMRERSRSVVLLANFQVSCLALAEFPAKWTSPIHSSFRMNRESR